MTFQASPVFVGAISMVSVAATGALAWAEWRRSDGRRLPWRLGATALAVVALALLALRPEQPPNRTGQRGHGIEAALYTFSTRTTEQPPLPASGARRFALPDTPASAAPPDAVVLPDAAAFQRRFQQAGTLHVYGDGLEPYDLPALRPWRVVFHPPDAANLAQPAVDFLACPRELPLGEPLTIQGRVGGVPPGGTCTLALAAPDGSSTEATTSAAGKDGSAVFTIRGAAPPAAGRFEWRLRLLAGGRALSDDLLGVAVVRPVLPRVLVLETTPRFDTTSLRRWFEQAGGTLTARTQVGKDLYRFFGPAGPDGTPPKEFASIDAALLSGFDLVLADGRSLRALGEPERAALHAAVADGGLGVLTLADNAVFPAPDAARTDPAKPAPDFPLPWTLLPIKGGPEAGTATQENADRSVRPRWPGTGIEIGTPVEAAPFELPAQPFQTPLVHDDQGRTLAAAKPLGRGQLALTLVRETGRWNRANDPAAFAAYWSHLFSAVARRRESGSWSLTSGESGPVRVDEPLELVWQGPASGGAARPARITGETGETFSSPLIQDTMEPGRWGTAFWPRRAGWHHVTGETASFDFYVAHSGAWPELAAARRRAATSHFATESQVPRNESNDVSSATEAVPIASGWWFGLFLLGAGFLWVERRFSVL